MTNKNKRPHDVDLDGTIGWNDLDLKDKIAYVMSVILISSGIIMAFIALGITEDHNIPDGVLMYVGESFVTGGGLLGFGIYIKNKIGEMDNYIHRRLDRPEEINEYEQQ